jgi:HPt (histidine-containing phosphotransfer) domain-containing protein
MNPNTPLDADKAINVDELLARCMGNAEIAQRILLKFQERFGLDLEELEQALRGQDSEAITQAAHRMKGASANVAAPRIYKLVSEIEQLGRNERISEIPPEFARLRTEWKRLLDDVSTLELSQ